MHLPAYLANQPTASDLICLVVALVLFSIAAVWSAITRAWWQLLTSIGLAFLVLAFIVT